MTAARGMDAACEQVLDIRDSSAFEGVHLLPPTESLSKLKAPAAEVAFGWRN